MIKAPAYLLCSALVLAATPSFADWGAVAVNATTGHYGYSNGWSRKGEADQRAMHYCRQFSGNRDGCEVVLTTRRCGGVARARSSYYVAEASTASRAGQTALSSCTAQHASGCEIAREFCAER